MARTQIVVNRTNYDGRHKSCGRILMVTEKVPELPMLIPFPFSMLSDITIAWSRREPDLSGLYKTPILPFVLSLNSPPIKDALETGADLASEYHWGTISFFK